VILRLVSYNIRLGGRGREQALATVLAEANPDLVLFQEARDPGVIEQLSRDSGLPHWGARPGLSLGFMSRRPTSLAIWHKPRVSRHAFLEVELEGIDWRFFGVHLSAVHAAWTEQRRLYELRALLTAIGRQQPGPHSLAGDFNTVAPGELLDLKKLPLRLKPFVWMSGGDIRWRTIQQVLDAGYVDVGRHVLATVPPVPNAKPAVINTFPTWDPHQRLDYLFVPGGYVDRVRSCGVITNSATREASDHFPLVAEIDVSSSIA
jgi:endonuclease/exonuclease/phosphatase family metal-dependent hydrolase